VKKGEKVIWALAAMITAGAAYVGVVVYNAPTKLMPNYQIESVEAGRGELVYRHGGCSACHKIWNLGGRKGGPLDGIGSRRDSAWLTAYLSTDDPQAMLPSEVKPIFKMPSFASMSEGERSDMVAFLVSLKMRDQNEDDSDG